MPDTTPTYGLPFLEPLDPPDIAGGLEDLALEVEAELTRIDAAIVEDTGWVTTGFTNATNFTAGTVRYRILFAKIAFLELSVTKTAGADITASASGSFADTTILTIPAACRPAAPQTVTYRTSAISGSAFVNTTGVVQILDGHPTAVITTGHVIALTTSYLIT